MASKPFFKRITKIIAIVAVMIAMGLCALLVGCGKPQGDEGTGEPEVGIDNSGTNVDIDNNGTENNGGGKDGIIYIDPPELPPTHFISTLLETEYDADNFVIPMSYACPNTYYPLYNYRENSGYKVTDYQICFYALIYPEKDIINHFNYEEFDAMQAGEIYDNIYMIEKLSFPKNDDGIGDMAAAINTINSYYGVYYDQDNEYWIYDHNLNVNFPREYLNDSGTVYFGIRYLYTYTDVSEWSNQTPEKYFWGNTTKPPHFDYSVEGDKVKLTKIDNGAHTIKPYGAEEAINKSPITQISQTVAHI